MPYFKKKRSASPNKNAAKIRRAEAAENKDKSLPVLGQRWPDVARMTIRLRFHANGNEVKSETMTFEPNTPIRTKLPCPGICAENGSFELEDQVQNAVAARKTKSESSASCQEQLYAGVSQLCGCQLHSVIELTYRA